MNPDDGRIVVGVEGVVDVELVVGNPVGDRPLSLADDETYGRKLLEGR